MQRGFFLARVRQMVLYLVLKPMKFAKGLLDEESDVKAAEKPIGQKMNLRPRAGEPASKTAPTRDNRQPETAPALKEDHLFETQAKTIRSTRHYLTLIGIVAVFVLIGGGLI